MAEDGKNEANLEDALDLGALGSFDFTPDWARGRSDDKAKYAHFEQREERLGDEGRRRFGGGAPRGRDDGGRRPPRRASSSDGEGRRNAFGDRRGPRPFGDRRGDGQGRPARPFVKPLDVDVRILPSQKDLGTIIKRIQTTGLAYPLKQLVMFFLDNPESCILRLSPKEGADVHFHQCKACGHLAFSADELQAHVLSAHLSDYYDSEEVDCEPPKGNFSCVARCGMSGVLLGPPNLHGYDARIREVIRSRFPEMDEAAFRSRIEMVHDADMVEEWRKSVTKKTVYRRKPAKDAAATEAEGEVQESPALDREAAEREFRRVVAASLVSEPKTPDVTAAAALKSENRPLLFACRSALERERRRPHDLSRALRGAFHHRKLVFFRANSPDGQEFVCSVKPSPLDTAHAIPELVELVKYVEEHPDQLRQAVVAALSGGDPKKAADVKAHLSWLVEKGHLVNFSVGILSAPDANPRFRPPRRPAASAEAKPREKAEAASAPAGEPASSAAAEESAAPTAEPASESASAETAKAENA